MSCPSTPCGRTLLKRLCGRFRCGRRAGSLRPSRSPGPFDTPRRAPPDTWKRHFMMTCWWKEKFPSELLHLMIFQLLANSEVRNEFRAEILRLPGDLQGGAHYDVKGARFGTRFLGVFEGFNQGLLVRPAAVHPRPGLLGRVGMATHICKH
jgi:hypothetical protein